MQHLNSTSPEWLNAALSIYLAFTYCNVHLALLSQLAFIDSDPTAHPPINNKAIISFF